MCVHAMDYFTYRFDKTPCWVVTTYIPEPKRKQGIQQILAGSDPKTTPLILYNDPDILKYITIEKENQPIQVRQMLGGIAIVDTPTLVVALKALKTWLNAGIKPEIAFFQTQEAAQAARDILSEKVAGYQDALINDVKPRVPEMQLEVLDFGRYIREAIAKYGENKNIEQLLDDVNRAQIESQAHKPSKLKSLFKR